MNSLFRPVLLAATMVCTVSASHLVTAQTTDRIGLQMVSTYKSGVYNAGAAEIVAFDSETKKLFVVNASANTLDVLSLADVKNPSLLTTISFAAYGAGVNSVAVKDGLVAAAVEATIKQDPGTVVFLDAATHSVLKTVTVGALPDMVTFNEDGSKALTANEGEPSIDYLNDPEGSVSIIDLSSGVANATVTTVGFTDFNFGGSRRHEIDTLQVRVYGKNATVAKDLEPEYITIKGDNAWVTLQENNAIALINIASASVEWIKPLGFKNHNLAGNGLDASDRDVNYPSSGSSGKINIANWPVFGMYQPDGIASFFSGEGTWLVTANEGDAREYGTALVEEVRFGASAYKKDPVAFTDSVTLETNQALGRLTIVNTLGDRNRDGRFDSAFVLGARSFSVWNAADGSLVWDSGDQFERFLATEYPVNFNSSNNNNSLDDRSDNKGPEPEGIATATIGDSLYAFIGLERVGGIMVYNITDPMNPVFVDYANNRDFGVTPGAGTVNTVGDLGPEGLLWIPASDSPNGRNLLVVGNEISGTTTIYEVAGPVAFAKSGVSADGTITIGSAGIADLTFSGVSPGTVLISQVDGEPASVTYTGVPDPPSTIAPYRIVLDAISGLTFSSASITFDFSLIAGAGITDVTGIRVFKRDTPGSGDFSEVSVLSASGSQLTVLVSSFSEFMFGSDNNPLPVELSRLSAQVSGSSLIVTWSTETETSNAGFRIEGLDNDNRSWKTLGFLAGHGTTTTARSYRFETNQTSLSKIRLVQTDLDGTVTVLHAIEVENQQPVRFSVEQNYPNPFNPSTTIRFSLPVASPVSIRVTDLTGRVLTEQKARYEAGSHQVALSAAGLASGMYYYTVSAGSYNQTRKMVVLK